MSNVTPKFTAGVAHLASVAYAAFITPPRFEAVPLKWEDLPEELRVRWRAAAFDMMGVVTGTTRHNFYTPEEREMVIRDQTIPDPELVTRCFTREEWVEREKL